MELDVAARGISECITHICSQAILSPLDRLSCLQTHIMCTHIFFVLYLDALPNTVIATLEEKDVIQPFVLVSIVGI